MITLRRPGPNPIVFILLTILLCVSGLGVFLLNNETFFNYEEAEVEMAYQQTNVVHTPTTLSNLMKAFEEASKKGSTPGDNSSDEEPKPEDHTPGEQFADVTSDSISYNWKAQVNINSLGVVDNPGAYDGMTREFNVDYYKNYSFSKSSRQAKLHDKIANNVINDDGYAMYDGYLLMVAPLSVDGSGNWVGCKGTMTDANGKSIKVIYVDAKGNLAGDDVVVNADETIGVDYVKGHHIGGHIDVVELEADKGTSKTTFKAKFGLDLSTVSPVAGFTKGESII